MVIRVGSSPILHTKNGTFRQKNGLKVLFFCAFFCDFAVKVSKIGVKIILFSVSNHSQKSSFLLSFNKYSSDRSV